jgi:hypothetical protein
VTFPDVTGRLYGLVKPSKLSADDRGAGDNGDTSAAALRGVKHGF